MIRAKAPGDTVTISFEREGEPMEVQATLTRRGG